MKLFSTLLVFLSLSINIFADVFEDVGNSFRSGDIRQISMLIGATVDLTVINQEDVYSKAQAEQIIRDFIQKNPCKSFTIVHKGSSRDGLQYAIGNMISAAGKTFRISFYIKNAGGKNTIEELRIETE